MTYERNFWEKIADKLRSRSMWMLHYCTGCGAIELPPSMTSRFDMERLGMAPMATPRQADIFLITGYLSTKTLRRVIYTYEQMQDPKYVVGFGSCTLNGGIYYDSYSTINRLDYYIPVDLYIAGCMPRPEAIFEAFTTLMEMIRKGKALGWKRYRENYEWYKQNQLQSLGEVYVHDEFHE
ncbi:MAG: NADH-quinone oxidoreductase subunit B [Thermotogae bacterium]|nr:NADH-quinone oxidoreductase subunit B [Thermotogota bacterium]